MHEAFRLGRGVVSWWALATTVGAAAMLSSTACRTGARITPEVALLPQQPPARLAELDAAAEAYFTATTTADLRAAVARAESIAPDSVTHHELAANLALLEDRLEDRFDHLYEALRDPANPQADLHLELMLGGALTLAERSRAVALLRSLAENHPEPSLRARAAFKLARLLFEEGDLEGARWARGIVGDFLPLAVVGAWDNDQGKGFDSSHPPEDGLDLGARYDGTLVDIGWRRAPLADPADGTLDLAGMLTPSQWSLAYGATAVEVPAAGDFELRVLSSVPFKVWVNDGLVFAERRIEEWVFDQFIIPVRLVAGKNKILIKYAQNQGVWRTAVRLTGLGGVPVPGLVAAPADAGFVPPAAGHLVTSEDLVEQRVSSLPEGSARRAFFALRWARMLGLNNLSVGIGDALLHRYASSIAVELYLAAALWTHKERGRAADLLEALDERVGPELPFVRLQYARFLRQENLHKKARKVLLETKQSRPGLADVRLRLARQFEAEGWHEDRCIAQEEALELRPQWTAVELALGDCLSALDLEASARALYRSILEDLPQNEEALRRLMVLERDSLRLDDAEDLAQRLVEVAPHHPSPWMHLGEIQRRAGRRTEAEAALERALAIDPDLASAWRALGAIAYQDGDRREAVRRWQAALVRNPEDETLANRLSFLAPEAREPWETEIPEDAEIDEVLRQRSAVRPAPGADIIEILDHMVTRINADGSTSEVITRVLHAVNDSGRDQLTTVSLGQGRIRVLAAYAVDPQGQRTQVSSVRGRTARFRGLKVGSTVVLQYRTDQRPVGYLARHVARSWWFESASTQRILSQWVVWAPADTEFHEWINGKSIEREERREGDSVRLSWSARNVPPLIPEPNMPTAREASMNMLVSTVPSWDTFLEWEKALLSEAFRESAEVKSLAQALLAGLDSPKKKLERIHRYLMEEIRYQQDYEDHIAGVKPHAATVVLKRGYGDCKDKAVLFITLARLAGLDVHFALLRTRTHGPLQKEVPMQQFNHAIVYVPAQGDLTEGRFYDPTADALDVTALRADDPGALALVLNPTTQQHTWIPIPYQSPDANGHEVVTRLELAVDGSAHGEMIFSGRGQDGSGLRRLARNREKLEQGMQLLAARSYPGASTRDVQPVEVTDLEAPAKISVKLEARSLARAEGAQLRFALPEAWSPDAIFRLPRRRYPLVLGVPREQIWRSEITIPAGLRVERLPPDGKIEADCFSYARTTRLEGTRIVAEQRFASVCERISTEQYEAHRARAEEVIRFTKEEVVLTRKK